jgi:hypothetical protein
MRVGNGREKTRLLSLHDLDKRTAAYRRTEAFIAGASADCGGVSQLSTTERAIIQRAAVTNALAENLETRWLNGEDRPYRARPAWQCL